MCTPARSRNSAPAAALLSAVAVAAEPTAAPTVETVAIEEIIVTATRRETRLQSAPPSVHVLTAEQLRRTGAVNFADYARSVPGLSFTDGGSGGEKQTMRGISISPWFEINSGTAVLFNEVPLTSAGGTTGPPFNPDPALIDIDRIEVLRGPQGTLFGAGSMGGAIRIIGNAPDTEETAGELGAEIASTTDGELGYGLFGVANLALPDHDAAVRAVAYQHDRGGFIDNVATDTADSNNRRTRGLRLAASTAAADNLSLTVQVNYQDRHSDGLTHEDPAIGERKQSRIGESIGDEWLNLSVTVDAEFVWGTLMSSTSWLDRTVNTMADVSFFLRVFLGLDGQLNVVNEEAVGEFVQELRLVSDEGDRSSWLAGVFYQDTYQDVAQDFPAPGFDAMTDGLASEFGLPDNLFVRRETYWLRQVALYGEFAYRMTDRTELSVGGRWYDIDRRFVANNRGFLFVMGEQRESLSAGDSGLVPSVGASVELRDEWSLFGRVSSGFRPGGINPQGPVSSAACAQELQDLGFAEPPTGYRSDDVVSYEIGMRYRAADGRLRLSAAAYHVDWSDMQTEKLLDCGAGIVENAGAADSDGVELELAAVPYDNVEFLLAASYTKAELSEDVPNLGGASGDRLPGVPRLTASAGLTYTVPAFRDGSLSLNVDLHYVGDSYMGFDEATSRKLPAYSVMRASAGFRRGRWSATVFVDNAADETAAIFINDNILGEWQTPIRPRTVGLRLNRRF